jgi:hypothetical protein
MTSPPPVPTSLPASDPATASASAASFPLEAILRPSEAVRETAPCRLRTSVGRLHAEVAVLQSTLPSDRTESW